MGVDWVLLAEEGSAGCLRYSIKTLCNGDSDNDNDDSNTRHGNEIKL